ncbi:hypothetical protein QFC20_004758 [Naganishia adeliensis]|uniref:Uncharacterized protein n=1 Tax=Naganishia adeliensis TaxID=92952 RepID=A0ACC2VXJ8_9TREE|nr:hypothetical protein QFC20_004758 [Naganishia adeliensis]
MQTSLAILGLGRLLAAFGCYILLLSPHVASFYTGASGDFGKDGVVQHQVYNITWGPVEEVSYIDVYLGQQRDKDDVFLNDRRFEQVIATNVTDMPFRWNVTQPVGTTWVLTPVPMGYKASLGSFTGLTVTAATSAAANVVPKSVSLSILLGTAAGVFLRGTCRRRRRVGPEGLGLAARCTV